MSKKILFIVPYVPNIIRVRPYNLIRHLSDQGHQITLLTLWTDEQERASIEQIKPYCERLLAFHLFRWRSLLNCLGALFSKRPLQTVYCWEPNMARQIRELVNSRNGRLPFDVIHVEHLRGAYYGLQLKSLLLNHNPPLPIVWDSVDSISLLFRQAMVRSKSILSRGLTRFELSRTERYEAWLLNWFDHILVTSQADKDALLGLPQGTKKSPVISVIHNGVDLNYFKPDERVSKEPATLVISGKMSYHANVAMVLHLMNEIIPHVWAQRADAKVLIVGKDPPREVTALAANPNVIVTGTVAHLPPYLQRSTVVVAPIAYGAGIQNKVLEGMSCGTPVVATSQAVSALAVKPDRDVLVAEEPAVFAAAIMRLLDNPQKRAEVGRAGRCYVEKNHRWAVIADQLEKVYESSSRGKLPLN
jgi:polysaccharide biosynthesis protein PslH